MSAHTAESADMDDHSNLLDAVTKSDGDADTIVPPETGSSQTDDQPQDEAEARGLPRVRLTPDL